MEDDVRGIVVHRFNFVVGSWAGHLLFRVPLGFQFGCWRIVEIKHTEQIVAGLQVDWLCATITSPYRRAIKRS
jgi:hypothetical protein